jgi:hypothetical protein
VDWLEAKEKTSDQMSPYEKVMAMIDARNKASEDDEGYR